jgi:hypothetical protein
VIEGEKARRHMLEHLGNRPVLSMDQLVEMKDLRPRIEKEMKLPSDKRGARNRIYFFTVDGTYRGKRYTGCLFAGECIMVQSDRGFEFAHKQAKDGLAATMEIATELYEEQARMVVEATPMEKMIVDAGGRRSGAGNHAPDLATDEKLKRMIQHEIGGKPWRG